jgi:hypothetical protein
LPRDARRPARGLRLARLLGGLRRDGEAEPLTVGLAVDHAAHAGFGFVLALVALLAIPFVGASTPFGLVIAGVGAQLIAGRPRPWLPGRLRRLALPAGAVNTIAAFVARITRWMAHLVRPRLGALCRATSLVGLGIVIHGLGLALPLPIPGSNLVFLVPVLIYAIGLLEDDGVLIAVGHVATVGAIGLGFVLWEVVVAVLGAVFG